jgi:LEA14-like dessication related protein
MRQNTVILLVLAAAVGYWAYTRYGAVTNLQFVPRGISLSGSGFQITLGVQNTSNVGLQYNSFAGSLQVNGANVASVQDFQPVAIAPNAESDLQINVTPNLLGLASQALSQIQNGVTGIQSAVLTGTANIGGAQYPVNVQLV